MRLFYLHFVVDLSDLLHLLHTINLKRSLQIYKKVFKTGSLAELADDIGIHSVFIQANLADHRIR